MKIVPKQPTRPHTTLTNTQARKHDLLATLNYAVLYILNANDDH